MIINIAINLRELILILKEEISILGIPMIIILFLKIIIISIKKKKKIKILILILGNLKFPYLVYFEKIEGNSNNNDDAVSNRFILKKLRKKYILLKLKKILKRTF